MCGTYTLLFICESIYIYMLVNIEKYVVEMTNHTHECKSYSMNMIIGISIDFIIKVTRKCICTHIYTYRINTYVYIY